MLKQNIEIWLLRKQRLTHDKFKMLHYKKCGQSKVLQSKFFSKTLK